MSTNIIMWKYPVYLDSRPFILSGNFYAILASDSAVLASALVAGAINTPGNLLSTSTSH